jgi:hypothetical protein
MVEDIVVNLQIPSAKLQASPDGPLTHQPDPGENASRFLAMLLKEGAVKAYSKCAQWCERRDLDLEAILESIPVSKLRRATVPGKDPIQAVWLVEPAWAGYWVRHYDTERGHHGKMVVRKKSL